MKRKTSFLLLLCFSGSILIIVFLNLFANRINFKKNGFVRLFPPHLPRLIKKIDIHFNSFYFCGFSSDHIYLGNLTAPTYLLVCNYSLSDTHHVRLNISHNIKIAGEALRVKIDSPYVYMMEGITSSFLRSTLDSSHKNEIIDSNYFRYSRLDSIQFNASIPISKSSFILRTYDYNLKQNILVKAMLQPNDPMAARFVLEKQRDGIFSTDGMLNYEPKMGRIVYVYYYHNKFDCLDTNLKIIYKAKTIDTISRAKIKVAEISSEKITTMAAPPLYVNKKSCVSENWIFVHSGLLADNEDSKQFDKTSVIDIYSLKDGNYKFSFYIPNYKNTKLNSFCVRNKTLFALYDHYLFAYDLNFYP